MPVLSEAQVMTDLLLCKRCVSRHKGYTRQRHAVCDLGHFFALLSPNRRAKEPIIDLGGTPLLGSPADFGKLIAKETEKWAKVVKFSEAKAD
jgi:hypothetical protein